MQDITIRNVSLADAPRILEIYAWYVEHTVITFEYTVPSLEEFEGRMRRTMEKYPYLVIEKDGRLTNIQVLQTPDRSLSEEAIRVLQQSPKWSPGKQRNQPVRVRYTLPVEFRIQQ